jgi:hypothetical protein
MNIEHHAEQMEALRAAFHKLWTDYLLPRAIIMGAQRNQLPAIQDIAWQTFRIARAKRDDGGY